MNITINNKPTVTSAQNIKELLSEQKLDGKPIIVERNGLAVSPSNHDSESLAEGDRVELFMLGAGG